MCDIVISVPKERVCGFYSFSAVNKRLFRHKTLTHWFLGEFAELRKETISFFVSFRLSVRMKQLGPHCTDCHEIFYFSIFKKKGCRENSSFINPLNAELNPIRHLLALVGARHTVHVSRIRVKIGQE